MSVILVSGFEPFGGEKTNPSGLVASALAGREIEPDVVIAAVTLPVAWDRAFPALLRAATELGRGGRQIAAIVALGQASGYAGLGLERLAVNVASGVDSDGVEKKDEPIVPGGPSSYFSTLPLQAILNAIEGAGLPAFISNSAGTYLCNRAFYELQHYLAGGGAGGGAGGFIHVPLLPEQAVGKKPLPPSMSLPDIERGILAALGAVAATTAGGPGPD